MKGKHLIMLTQLEGAISDVFNLLHMLLKWSHKSINLLLKDKPHSW